MNRFLFVVLFALCGASQAQDTASVHLEIAGLKDASGDIYIGAPGMARSALTGAVPIRVVAVG